MIIVKKNKKGGYYAQGKMMTIEKKTEVKEIYERLCAETAPDLPSGWRLAKEAQISVPSALKIKEEMDYLGRIRSPQEIKETWNCPSGVNALKSLTKEQEIFLLSLRLEQNDRTLLDYTHELKKEFGVDASTSFIHQWWMNRFPYKGNFASLPLSLWINGRGETSRTSNDFLSFYRRSMITSSLSSWTRSR